MANKWLPKYKPPPRPKSAAVWFGNYFKVMTDEFVSELPAYLQEEHRRFVNATHFGHSLGMYYGVPNTRKRIDKYLRELNAYLKNKKKKTMYNKRKGAKHKPAKKARTRREEEEEEPATQKTKRGKAKRNYAYVDAIDEAVKLLRRFKNMAGKKVPVTRLLTFIKALQRAIHERRIRKSDRYASEVDTAQKIAIQTYQRSSGQNVEMKVPTAFKERVNEIARSEKVRPSVAFLKRFVGFVGKPYHETGARMKKLLENLGFMYERGMIRQTDPYYNKVKEAERALNRAISDRARINVPAATLSGLNGIIAEEESAAGFL